MRHLTDLKLRRLMAGLTCAELARALEVSRSHLALVENERRNPSASLKKRIREVFEAVHRQRGDSTRH